MIKNFWNELPQAFSCLAPMDDVTDFPFRETIAQFLPMPNVFFTEFTSSDGLCSKGQKKLLNKLEYSEIQRPIVAQIWGTNPTNIYESAKLVEQLGFDGLDINMGCPTKTVVKRGGGAALIKNPRLAVEIIRAAKSALKNIPLSVKTRLGFDAINTLEWIPTLLQENLAALTVHGRIATEMSKFPANWEEIKKAVEIKNSISPVTKIIGNGDVLSAHSVKQIGEKYGVDGAMIGRGIFQNPWVFEKTPSAHTFDQSVSVLLKHMDLHSDFWGERRYEALKKFFKMYLRGSEKAHNTREKLLRTKSILEAKEILKNVRSA